MKANHCEISTTKKDPKSFQKWKKKKIRSYTKDQDQKEFGLLGNPEGQKQ